jgi:hypothetical protein
MNASMSVMMQDEPDDKIEEIDGLHGHGPFDLK